LEEIQVESSYWLNLINWKIERQGKKYKTPTRFNYTLPKLKILILASSAYNQTFTCFSHSIMPSQRRPHADLTERERSAIAGFLMAKCKNFKLEHGALQGTAMQFNCSARTVKRLWQQLASSIASSGLLPDFSVNGHGRTGRKRKVTDISDRIRLVPWRDAANCAAWQQLPTSPRYRVAWTVRGRDHPSLQQRQALPVGEQQDGASVFLHVVC